MLFRSPGLPDAGVRLAQLRGVLAAQQSAEVAQKDQHNRAGGPVVAEAVWLRFGVQEFDRCQRRDVHGARVYAT